jgi:hypothetical protein
MRCDKIGLARASVLEAVIQLIEPHGGGRDLLASAEGGILVVTGSTARHSAERPLQDIP